MTTLTPDTLSMVMPRAASLWVDPLNAAATEFGINLSTARLAAFLGQIAEESVELTHVEENLNYSSNGLLSTWPSRFTHDTAMTYAHNPEGIANHVYANRNGNGDEASGDGYLYRGRGPIQLTGKANYAAAGAFLGLPIDAEPDDVKEPTVGARVAGWYWHTHGINALCDEGDWQAVTRAVNGGLLGFPEREAYRLKAVAALG